MNPETIVIYLNLAVSSSVLFFIIWDHLRDDRLLAQQIHEFYVDIEMLIFTSIQIKYYDALEKKESEKKEKIDTDLVQLKKYRNRDIIQNSYLKVKVRQNFAEYSKYLGLTIDSENLAYLNRTAYVLNQEGEVSRRNFETRDLDNVIKSYIDIKNEEITEIKRYLNSIRFYWNKNYKKFIFRPSLNEEVEFDDLLGFSYPLEEKPIGWRGKFKKKIIR